jgi:protein involved in polysaccharide export with SLBB domain
MVTFTLPLIGRVQAGGFTVEQLEAELNTGLKKYMHDPQVSVTVAEFRSQPVSVFGAVTKPGVIQLRGRKTLYEVLSMAGGPTRDRGLKPYGHASPRKRRDPASRCATVDPTGQFSTARVKRAGDSGGKEPGGEYRDQAQ